MITPFGPPNDELDRLNTILDAQATGKRAPAIDPASDTTAALANAARLVSGYASTPGDAPSTDTLDSIWRNVMNASSLAIGHAAPTVDPSLSARRAVPRGDATRASRHRGGRLGVFALSATVALVLMIGMIGANRFLLGPGNGGGPGDPPRYLAAVQLPNGSEVNIEYRVPTAEECTVDPLTVDEVMDRLHEYGRDGRAWGDARATAIAQSATPVPKHAEGNIVFPVSDETFGELVAAQNEWLACTLHGSPFQVWALETNVMIRQQFQARYMPVFDMETIRADLEALAEEESSRESAEVPADAWLPMVPAESGYNTFQRSDIDATLTVFWMNGDGEALLGFGATADDPQLVAFMEASSLEQTLPNGWNFLYDEASGRWLLNEMTTFMG